MKNAFRVLAKWVGAAATAALLFGVLPGGRAHAETIVLQFWTTWGGIRHEAWLPIVEQFNAQSETIKIEAIDRSAYPDPLFTALAGGVAPDIVGSSIVWTRDHAARGVLKSISPYLERDGLLAELQSDLFPGFLEPITYDGEIYAIPMNGELYWTFANRAVLDESGVAEPQPGWTWDDFRATLRQIVRINPDGTYQRIAAIGNRGGIVIAFMAQAGARWLDETGTRPVFNSEATRRTFNFLEELMASNLLMPDTRDYSRITTFQEGIAAFSIDGSQRTGVHAEAMPAGSFFIPHLTAGPAGPAAGASTLTVSMVNTGNPEREAAAWEALKYLGSARAQAMYNAYVRAIPVLRSAVVEDVYQARLGEDEALQQWVTRVLPYVRMDGRVALPAEATNLQTEVWNTFINVEAPRPPVESYIEEIHARLEAALRTPAP